MSETLDTALAHLPTTGMERGVSADGIEYVRVPPDVIPLLVDAVMRAGFGRFIDLTAVDEPRRSERFELQYLFHSTLEKRWLRLKTRTDGTAPSIVARAEAANWYEREVFDLFGIAFRNHPDLRRILMPEGWMGFPLRKDYPVHGFKYSYHNSK